jgi:hypothetical protein
MCFDLWIFTPYLSTLSFNITRNWIWHDYKYGRHIWVFQYSKVNTIDVYSKILLLTDASLANLITENNEQACFVFRKWRLLLLLAASKSRASVLALRSAQTPVQAVLRGQSLKPKYYLHLPPKFKIRGEALP